MSFQVAHKHRRRALFLGQEGLAILSLGLKFILVSGSVAVAPCSTDQDPFR